MEAQVESQCPTGGDTERFGVPFGVLAPQAFAPTGDGLWVLEHESRWRYAGDRKRPRLLG